MGRMPRVVARALTFLAVVFAWVLFRATHMDDALIVWAAMLGQGAAGTAPIALGAWAGVALLLGIAWFAPNTQEIMARFEPALDAADVRPARWTWRPNLATALGTAIIAAPALYFILFTDRVSDFLYFQF
jgi:hypothetical protein